MDGAIDIPFATDVGAKLPKAARAKLAAMREARDDARALNHSTWQKLSALRDKHDEAETDVTKLERAYKDGLLFTETDLKHRGSDVVHGVRRSPNDQPLNEAKAKLTKIDAELARLQSQYDARSATWQALAQLVTRVERFILALDGAAITPAPAKAVKRVTGDKLATSIETVRKTVASLKADRRDVMMAPLPSSMAKAAAKAWVEAQAEAARPQTYGLLDGTPNAINFPRSQRIDADLTVVLDGGKGFGVARGPVSSVDPVGLACWLHPEAMIAALERDIDEIASDDRALDPATRGYKDDEISMRILEAEREEEALIEFAIADGMAITRRNDADVRAILGLSSDLPEERD